MHASNSGDSSQLDMTGKDIFWPAKDTKTKNYMGTRLYRLSRVIKGETGHALKIWLLAQTRTNLLPTFCGLVDLFIPLAVGCSVGELRKTVWQAQ